MRRRTVLATLGTALGPALAGCSSSDDPGDGGDGSDASDGDDGATTDTPTDTPTPPPQADVSVLDHELVTFEGKYSEDVYVRATVENAGDGYAGLLEPAAEFLDADGEVIDDGSMAMQGLPPGDTWDAYVRYVGSESPSDYNFSLAHDSSFTPEYGVEGAEVLESTLDTVSDVKVTGTIENTGDGTFDYLEAKPHFYAEDGTLLWIGLTNVTDLGPGETWDFSNRLPFSTEAIADRAADHLVKLTT